MSQPRNRKQAAARRRDDIPTTVPFAATPAGETPGIDQWAHPAVWTERMLTTLLEDKVKGGKWHTLNDKVFCELNLFYAARKVLGKKGAAGIDRQTVDDFAEHEREELRHLLERLRNGTYTPSPVRRAWIPKPGSSEKRPLGIPTMAAYCTSFNGLWEWELTRTVELLRFFGFGMAGTIRQFSLHLG